MPAKRRFIFIPMTITLALLVSLSVFFWVDLDARSQHTSHLQTRLSASSTWQRPVAANNIGGDPEYGTFDQITAGHRACPYGVLYFSPESAGDYTIEMTLARFEDPMLFLYDEAFDPQTPLEHFRIGDDDSGHVLRPKIESRYLSLQEDKIYALVVSSFWSDVKGETQLQLRGPGAIMQHHPVRYQAGENGSLQGPAKQLVASQGEGEPVTAIAAAGYRFAGWSDGVESKTRRDENLSEPLFVTAQFVLDSEQSYVVEHHLQNEDKDGYELHAREEKQAEPGKLVSAAALAKPGFSENLSHPERIESGRIPDDEPLILRLYYDRKLFTLSWDSQSGSPLKPQKVAYKTLLPEPSQPQKPGYDFQGWSWAPEKDPIVDFSKERMPAENLTLFALWQPHEATPYTIEYYLQRDDRSGYKLAKQKSQTAESGSMVTAPSQSFEGYRLWADHPRHKDRGRIRGDGSLTLKLFYDLAPPVQVAALDSYLIIGLPEALRLDSIASGEARSLSLRPAVQEPSSAKRDLSGSLEAVKQQGAVLGTFELSVLVEAEFENQPQENRQLKAEDFRDTFLFGLPLPPELAAATLSLWPLDGAATLPLSGDIMHRDGDVFWVSAIDAPGPYALVHTAAPVARSPSIPAESPADDLIVLHLLLVLLYPIALLSFTIRNIRQKGN